MVSGLLKRQPAQPHRMIGNLCFCAELVRVQKRGSTGKILVIEFDLRSQQLCQKSRPLAGEASFDTGNIIFRRRSPLARHLAKIREGLLLGLLGRTAKRENG